MSYRPKVRPRMVLAQWYVVCAVLALLITSVRIISGASFSELLLPCLAVVFAVGVALDSKRRDPSLR